MKTITSTFVPTTLPTPGNHPSVVDALRATPMAEAIRFGEVVLQIESITAERLATVPVSAIDELIGLLDDIAGRIKTAQSEVAKTLTARYADHAKAQLLAEGKDTGTTHIFDGEFDVTVEVDKTIKWDQKQLATLFERIAANGDKPGQYIDLKYAVSEAKFKAWPETLRQPFEAARTVTPGKPKFTLRCAGEGK